MQFKIRPWWVVGKERERERMKSGREKRGGSGGLASGGNGRGGLARGGNGRGGSVRGDSDGLASGGSGGGGLAMTGAGSLSLSLSFLRLGVC